MRLSRHAKNQMRLYRITLQDIETVIAAPASREFDERGNHRLTGVAPDRRRILVIIAADDPEFVITVYLRS